MFGAARVEPIGEIVVLYLNRLNDALFVLACWANKNQGAKEVCWEK